MNDDSDAVVDLLTLERVDDDEAYEALAEAADEAAEQLADAGYPLHDIVVEELDEIVEEEGLIDMWAALILLAVFSHGIAVGKGRDHITAEDVEDAKENLCDSWPCSVGRVEGFGKALRRMAESEEE